MQKYLPGTIERSRALTMLTNDSLNWSHREYHFRVRLNRKYLKPTRLGSVYINPDFSILFESNTKARRFHGYLEDDYVIATCGFYTNNFDGVCKLFNKYPLMFESIQTYDQYFFAQQMADLMVPEAKENLLDAIHATELKYGDPASLRARYEKPEPPKSRLLSENNKSKRYLE